MISKFDLAKALYDNAKTISDANGFTLIADGEKYETDPKVGYVREFTLFGDDEPIGISDDSSDIQRGIYQLTIYTPKVQEGGKWKGLKDAETYQAGFARGLQLTYNGQTVRIRNSSVAPTRSDDTHFMTVLSVRYSVIN